MTGAPFSLAFLTDRRRIANPEPVLRALPAGAAVVYRDYDDARREAVARRVASLCRARRLLFIVGGDIALARRVGADGVHYPSRMLGAIEHAPGLIVSAACHDPDQLQIAHRRGAQVAFLSPVFATASHPGAEHLGPARCKAIAAASPLPVLALGGVDETNAGQLMARNVVGFCAIGAFVVREVF